MVLGIALVQPPPLEREGFGPATLRLFMHYVLEPFIQARLEELETGMASIGRGWDELSRDEKRRSVSGSRLLGYPTLWVWYL
jgi:hypothetical protein